MHGLKTPTFLLRSRPSSPAPQISPPGAPMIAPTPVTPLELNEPRRLGKLLPFRRASPSPSPAPLLDKPSAGSNYLDALSLRISEAAGKALASPASHNSDGLLLGGRRPLPAGRGKSLGQLIHCEITAASNGGNDLLRASLRALHRPLNVLLTNVNSLVAQLVLPTTNILAPTSGWVGNGAPQAHALGLAILVGELLEGLESLPVECARVGGEGLRAIKEGLEGVVKRVISPVLAAVRTELSSLVDALEHAPLVVKKDAHPLVAAMPCAIRVHTRIASVPGSVVRGALATCQIAIVWRAMLALSHRPISEPRPEPKSNKTSSIKTLGKTQSSSSIGSPSLRRLTPPNTPPARFGLLLPPSRPPSPTTSPAAQLASDARSVVALLDGLPKPASDDAREAVQEAFTSLRALADLLSLLAAPLDPAAIVQLVEDQELPVLVVLPAVLRKSVAGMLGMDEVEYRERCLSGFGRAEASEDVVVAAVVGRVDGWVREWLEAREE